MGSTLPHLLFGSVVADLGDEERLVGVAFRLRVFLRVPLRDHFFQTILIELDFEKSHSCIDGTYERHTRRKNIMQRVGWRDQLKPVISLRCIRCIRETRCYEPCDSLHSLTYVCVSAKYNTRTKEHDHGRGRRWSRLVYHLASEKHPLDMHGESDTYKRTSLDHTPPCQAHGHRESSTKYLVTVHKQKHPRKKRVIDFLTVPC